MQIDIRAYPPGPHKESRIRHKQGVRPDLFQKGKIFVRLFQIRVMGQDIDRDVDLHAVFMGEPDPLRHLFLRKILSLCPEGESLPSDIDRIRPVEDGCLQYLQAGSRNQQLRQLSFLMHLILFLLYPAPDRLRQ